MSEIIDNEICRTCKSRKSCGRSKNICIVDGCIGYKPAENFKESVSLHFELRGRLNDTLDEFVFKNGENKAKRIIELFNTHPSPPPEIKLLKIFLGCDTAAGAKG